MCRPHFGAAERQSAAAACLDTSGGLAGATASVMTSIAWGSDAHGSGDPRDHPTLIDLASDDLELSLAPTIGGAIAAFRFKATDGHRIDLLRPMDAAALVKGDVLGASCFPLTPFSNRLRLGRCHFQGQDIRLAANSDGPHTEHGHGWQRAWQVDQKAADQASLTYRHQPDEWPFAYQMCQHL